jgi:hypothetical protein
MKPLFIPFLMFLGSCTFQKKTQSFVIQIDSTTKIVFTDAEYIKHINNKIDTFFCAPKIVKNTDTISIGYISDFCGFTDEYNISPNKQYLIIHRIESGWIEDIQYNGHIDSIWYEKYFCYLIDINNNKVLSQFQSGCDGHWNEDNEWIYSSEEE